MSKKNGTRRLDQTTPIPNVVLDEWLPYLSPSELKVVLYVIRRTAGFQKDRDQISIEKMMSGIVRSNGKRLDYGTGLKRTACREAIRSLIRRGALQREDGVSENGMSEPPYYSLNFSWQPSEKPEGVSDSRQGEGVGIPTGVGVSENRPHKRKNSPMSSLLPSEAVSAVSTPGAFPKESESQKTPPSSSSETTPVGSRYSGTEKNPEKNDDDEKLRNSKNPRKDDEGTLGGDNDIRVYGETVGKSTAAKGSWQSLSDEILSLSTEKLTDEAQKLGGTLQERMPRIELARTKRLALKCIQTGSVAKLGSTVAVLENECKGPNVRNPWAYLISSLFPLQETDEADDRDACERFGEAYEAATPLPSLGGSAAKVQYYGNSTRPRKPAADRFEKLTDTPPQKSTADRFEKF